MAQGKLSRLNDDAILDGLKKLSGWERVGDEIARTFEFKDYFQTMAFVNATAWISHQEDHHPDLEVGYNKCRVRYSTHSVGDYRRRISRARGEWRDLGAE